jgi:hypothetical protein
MIFADELTITIKSEMNPLDAEPMMSLDKFIEQTGLSAVTAHTLTRTGNPSGFSRCHSPSFNWRCPYDVGLGQSQVRHLPT